jgi:hypothetical protein
MSNVESHEEAARKLVAPGWPAVKEDIGRVFLWLDDPNCSAFPVIIEFLEKVPVADLVPHVREELRDPNATTYALLACVVGTWPREHITSLEPALLALAESENDDSCDYEAAAILVAHKLGDPAELLKLVERKKATDRQLTTEWSDLEKELRR